jgi:hypothetical protein
MAKHLARFGFQIIEGPNSGLCLPGWRVRTNREDTYITAKPLGDTWKTSLHGDVCWQHAVTKDHLVRATRPVWQGPDRAPWRFQPTPFVDGKRLAFVVATTRGALHAAEPEPKDHIIPVEDRWDELTMASVWMTEPGVELNEPGVFAGPLPLMSGRRVWLTEDKQRLAEAIAPESESVGAMVEPLWPEQHDVACPGFLVRGVRWSN